ncbi:MAG: hypothetical protein U0992_19895 [Planctomycetaceae bacterium]
MSEPTYKPKPRTRRRFLIGGVLVATLLLLILNVERQQLHVAELKRDIERAGGTVTLADPIYVQLWQKLRGGRFGSVTYVRLEGPAFNSQWLQEHDDLNDIKVNHLDLIGTQLDGSDISRLAKVQPLQWLRGQNVRNADAVARAFSNRESAFGLELPDSDLSDAGFRELPLEQLVSLDVSGSQVSLDAMKQLRNCRHLSGLIVDGRQFDAEIKDMILKLNRPQFFLSLVGPTVTDRHLELVRQMQVKGQDLDVFLVDAGASNEAINRLMGEFPPNRVKTGGR